MNRSAIAEQLGGTRSLSEETPDQDGSQMM